jgi:uncharacterized protein YbaR (Trm112 family)
MHISTLEILRCPFCGGRLELVTSLFHDTADDEIHNGILGCECCIFPVVAGIPVLHLRPQASTACDHIQAGRTDLAVLVMIGLEGEEQRARFQAAALDKATYRDLVEALSPGLEGGYFLYRFSDPSYLVAQAVVRAVAGTTLDGTRRGIDICGGSGHLTRSLLDLSSLAPVITDLYFAKVWLARRFTAPGCEAVCCDGDAPLPFARGAFRFAMCSDALMYIWRKRQFVGEMVRLIDGDGEPGAVLISHTHNKRIWSPSYGQPLSPVGYRDLFETLVPRIFGEEGLFADIVNGGPLDLGRRDPVGALDTDPALTIIASRHPGVFAAHRLESADSPLRGEYRVNPLYVAEPAGERVRLRLHFPSQDYGEEYRACRQYLPDEAVVDQAALLELATGRLPADLVDLARCRVILDLPKRYY